MPIVVLPDKRIVHGRPRIKLQPIPKTNAVIRPKIQLQTSYDTFVRPGNASFQPLLPFYISGMQNKFNVPDDTTIIKSTDHDYGLALNPIKKSNKGYR